ncbi:MAG TPA: hypothetical protein VFN40_01775, partial [Gemmatimonadales bacterium]|nr:hypothetical protein [Gemmatimonadales bacterium]
MKPLALTAITLGLAVPVAAQEPSPSPDAVQGEVHGLILMNAFANDAAVNNSDVPQFVVRPPAAGGPPASGAGATLRQSRVTATALVSQFAGGQLTGELDVDVFGGQQPSTGGRTFPLVRLRRAFAVLERGRLTLFAGQEAPPIAEINPSSLASIGIPEFAGAGNLWLWIPQLRVGARVAETGAVRLGVEAAVLAPTSGDPQTAFFTQPDIAERSSRPYLQGRVRLRWGTAEEQGEVSIGGHYGWLAVGPSRRVSSRALAVGVWTPLVRGLELRGEAYVGQALAGLGGGGIGQNFGLDSAVVETSGGWAQLNITPAKSWEIGAGVGLDDPDDVDLDPASQRLRNLAVEGHGSWRRAPIVLGAEVRLLRT